MNFYSIQNLFMNEIMLSIAVLLVLVVSIIISVGYWVANKE